MEETRACNSCGQVFPLTHDYFNYRDKAKGQFQGMCRECRHAYLNSRLENPEIRERERESKRRFYWTHKEQEKERGRIKNGRRYWGDEEFARRTGWNPEDAPSDYAFNCVETRTWPQAAALIGMPCKEFRGYMLKTFEGTYGYPWDGIEPVEIDHIIPLVTATTPDEVDALCHYSNLRLLKAKDNVAKGTSLDYQIS